MAPTVLVGRITAGHRAHPDDSWQGSVMASASIRSRSQEHSRTSFREASPMLDGDLEAQHEISLRVNIFASITSLSRTETRYSFLRNLRQHLALSLLQPIMLTQTLTSLRRPRLISGIVLSFTTVHLFMRIPSLVTPRWTRRQSMKMPRCKEWKYPMAHWYASLSFILLFFLVDDYLHPQ